MVTSYERVMEALALRIPDRVPTLEASVNKNVRKAMFPGNDPFGFEEVMDLDGIVIYEDQRKSWLTASTYVDEWGNTLANTEEDYPISVDFPLKSPEQLLGLKAPDPCAEWRFEGLRAAVKRFKGRKAIFFRLRDAYSLPRYLRGMENLLMDYMLNKDLARALAEKSVDYYVKMAHCAMELGADVFWTSDDYCDNRGPVMGLSIFREFILPGLKRLVAEVKRAGFPFLKHCDGNVTPILPDLVEAGISCLDPIDVGAGMSLAEVKHAYGKRIAVKGGMPLDILIHGTAEEIDHAVQQCLLDGGGGGGYIFSSCSDVSAAVPPRNYARMVQACKQFGAYPLDIADDARTGDDSKPGR